MDEDKVFSTPEYDALLTHVENAKKEVQAKARTAVGALFKAFFAANEGITAIRWTQYTPYFNDGEPCEFSTNEPYACTKKGAKFSQIDDDEDVHEEEDDDLFQDAYDLRDGPTKEALRSIGRAFDNDIFLAAFGDHAQIIATREGFHVTEYSHD